MKKIILGCALLSSSLLAQVYVGFGVGAGSFSVEQEHKANSGYSITGDTKEEEEGTIATGYINLGYIFETNNRLEISYYKGIMKADKAGNSDGSYSFGKKEVDIQGIDVNAIITIEKAGNKSFLPYFKVGAGVQKLELGNTNLQSNWQVEDNELTGVSVNFGGGVYVTLAQNFELDLGLLFKATSYDDLEHKNGSNKTATTETLAGSSQFYVGLNYKF